MSVFWGVAPCSLVEIAFMMKAVNTSEKSVNFCLTARLYSPENSHLHVFVC
jgi:hypothetical protein